MKFCPFRCEPHFFRVSLLSLALVITQVFGAESPSSDTAAETRAEVANSLESPLNLALDVQFMPSRFPNFEWAPGFQSNRLGKGARVALEWLPVVGRYGKAGVGLGLGYTKISKVPVTTSSSNWLEAFPVDGYLTYRFDYIPDQIFAPYLKAGFEREYARYSAGSGLQYYQGWTWGAGVGLLLDRIDPGSANQLDASTGINNTYLIVEYFNSRSATASNPINLSRDEVRVGLRFEL